MITEFFLQSILAKLAAIVVSLSTIVGSMSGLVSDNTQRFGTAIPKTTALFETSLATKLSSTATSSMTLVSGTDKDGNNLFGYHCFAVDEGTASEEFICGTASSTIISTLTRGISVTTGTTTVTSLQKEHRRGASVKITDYPQLAVMGRILNGEETIPNKLIYDNVATSSFTSRNDIINKGYADDLSYAGAPNASESVKGLVEIGTKAEIISATTTGGTGAWIVPTIGMVSATTSATTTIVATGSGGKISTGFIDQVSAYTWSGTHSNSATTTLATTTITNLQATQFNVVATTSLATTTFSVLPTVNSNPVSDTQLARKAYVDARVDEIQAPICGFTDNTDYTATTSGFVVANDMEASSANVNVYGYLGASTSTTFTVSGSCPTSQYCGFTMPVPINYHWRADLSGDNQTICWIPLY